VVREPSPAMDRNGIGATKIVPKRTDGHDNNDCEYAS